MHAGRAGYHVVTPLVLGDGRVVLVNRGFVPAGPTRDVLPSASPQSGDVRIRGRINSLRGATSSSEPTLPQSGVWQNLDPRASPRPRASRVAHRRSSRSPGRPTVSCATGRVPTPASTSTGSTWCSGSRSRHSLRGCGHGSHSVASAANDVGIAAAARPRPQGQTDAAHDRRTVIAPVVAVLCGLLSVAARHVHELRRAAADAPGAGDQRHARRRLAVSHRAGAGSMDDRRRIRGYVRRRLRAAALRDAPGAHDAGPRARAHRAGVARPRRRLRPMPGCSPSIRTSSSCARRRRAVAALPKGEDAIYLVDPLGNQVLAWPRDPDIKALARDLTRVLEASRIG